MLIPTALVALVLSVTPALTTPLPSANVVLAPLFTPPNPSASAGLDTDSHIIRDSYLVILDDHLQPHHIEKHHLEVEVAHATAQGARGIVNRPEAGHAGVVHKFSVGKKANGKKLHGYSGSFDERTLDKIRAMDGVKFVERDSVVWASEIGRAHV